MAEISNDVLKKIVADHIKGKRLSELTAKAVREHCEQVLKVSLEDRKTEVTYIIREALAELQSSSAESESDEDEDRKKRLKSNNHSPVKPSVAQKGSGQSAAKAKSSSSGSSDSDSDGKEDDEALARRLQEEEEQGARRSTRSGRSGATKTKKKVTKRRKKSSDDSDDSDNEGASGKKRSAKKKGNNGFTKVLNLSPELSEFLGESALPRHEVVKRIWDYCRTHDLQDPKNKQFAICDSELFRIVGVKRFRMFGMMKLLTKHFTDD